MAEHEETTFYIGPVQADAIASEPTRPEPTPGFRFMQDFHKVILEYQVSIARWIMASLVLVNGGAILALLNSAERFPALLPAAGPSYLAGIVAALASGTTVWFNCNFLAAAILEGLDFQICDYRETEKKKLWDRLTTISSFVAIALAFVSMGAFIFGSVRASAALS